jgi:hypothetical protein
MFAYMVILITERQKNPILLILIENYVTMRMFSAQDYSQQITWITLPAVNHRDGDKNIFFDFNLG